MTDRAPHPTIEDWRTETHRLRHLPVHPEIVRLGGQRIGNTREYRLPHGEKVWVAPDKSKFNSFTHESIHGEGPINFRVAYLGEKFTEARERVIAAYGTENERIRAYLDTRLGRSVPVNAPTVAPTAAPSSPPPAKLDGAELVMPAESPGVKSLVEGYLVGRRKLDREIVDELFRTGRMYPTVHKPKSDKVELIGAVFVMGRDPQSPTGAQIRWTHLRFTNSGHVVCVDDNQRFTEKHWMAPGTRKDLGAFAVRSGPADGPVNRIELVEGAIDAVSRKQLLDAAGKPGVAVLSYGGKGTVPERLIEHALRDRLSIRIAYDNDAPGNETSERVAALLSARGVEVSRAAPEAKDWNLDLVNRAVTPTEPARQASSHSMER